MSTYIKISTLEYPRHIGDIQRDSAGMADYALVQWTDPPAVSQMHRAVQKPPVKVGGQWMVAWEVQVRPLEEIVALIQKRLDDFAKTRNYDDIKSACGYAGCSVPKYDIEGKYARDKRAETWFVGLQILKDVQESKRPMPSSFAEIEAELPALVWPEV